MASLCVTNVAPSGGLACGDREGPRQDAAGGTLSASGRHRAGATETGRAEVGDRVHVCAPIARPSPCKCTWVCVGGLLYILPP